jgi:hydrogenase maturation protein HypF
MSACSIKIRGVVQGVGFRPFVFRLARANTLAGWVSNRDEGVEIFLEGADPALDAFVQELKAAPPPAARIVEIEIQHAQSAGLLDFTIRDSSTHGAPTTRIAPDMPVCDDCLAEMFDPGNKRFQYPYINCTNCGPRYSIVLRLPYDRQNTTMHGWPPDDFCAEQYDEPGNRRFHAQSVCCLECGPGYFLQDRNEILRGSRASIRKAAKLLASGKILAVKGLGGYHLACDAGNAVAIRELRTRKYRKEKAFALMARNLEIAKEIVELSRDAEVLLRSAARPIVIARAKIDFPWVAPGSGELGVMLPYTPVHHLLFEAGAPEILVLTSANRSNEPIAYKDQAALDGLSEIADSFLIGERPIARRLDDSVVRAGVFGPAIIRRSRGFAPGAVTSIPTRRPILALGADLKNTMTLVVKGQAFVSQHIGDLSDFQCLRAFRETIDDLISMYEVDREELLVVHDLHPEYFSTVHARRIDCVELGSVQHHRAHIASVLAERRAWDKRAVGVAFDGNGYGDEGTIWGGEFFTGSIREGFERVAHLRQAALAGGDAAAQYPVQAAAGFLAQLPDLPAMSAPPFCFPRRYLDARSLVQARVRTFQTSSVGRLFDAAAALAGFTHEISYEGQAAMWLEQLARTVETSDAYPFPFEGRQLDFRPLLRNMVEDRLRGRSPAEMARSFQRGVAQGLASAIESICAANRVDTAILSGGVFQNGLLLEDLHDLLKSSPAALWTNREVPANDGGISLGQAALAAFGRFDAQTPEACHA